MPLSKKIVRNFVQYNPNTIPPMFAVRIFIINVRKNADLLSPFRINLCQNSNLRSVKISQRSG